MEGCQGGEGWRRAARAEGPEWVMERSDGARVGLGEWGRMGEGEENIYIYGRGKGGRGKGGKGVQRIEYRASISDLRSQISGHEHKDPWESYFPHPQRLKQPQGKTSLTMAGQGTLTPASTSCIQTQHHPNSYPHHSSPPSPMPITNPPPLAAYPQPTHRTP